MPRINADTLDLEEQVVKTNKCQKTHKGGRTLSWNVLVAVGEVEVSQDGRSESGGPGFLSHFEPGERHSVKALSDARLVLVLAPWPGVGHPSRGPS